mgnify:CR=1 FL=1
MVSSSICNRRPIKCAQNTVRQEQHRKHCASPVNRPPAQPAHHALRGWLDQIVEHQPQQGEADHTADADDPADIPEQSPVIPQAHTKAVDRDPADNVLHNAGDPRAEQEQDGGVLLEGLHGVDAQRADAVDRQPWAVQNAPVSEHSLRIPVKNLLVNPAGQAADKKDHEQVAQPVGQFDSSIQCQHSLLSFHAVLYRKNAGFYRPVLHPNVSIL